MCLCARTRPAAKGVRQLLYGEGHGVYRILYRVKDENVEIVTIRHASRKPISR